MLCPIQAILSLPVKTGLCCHSAVGNTDFLGSALWAGAASKQTLSSSIPACFPPHFVHRRPQCWISASQSHSHGRDHANQQCHAVFWCQCPAFTWWGLKCVYSYCCYGVRSFTVSLILERLHLVSANTPWNFCLSLDINSSFFSKFKTLWTSEQRWTQGQVWLPFSTWEPFWLCSFSFCQVADCVLLNNPADFSILPSLYKWDIWEISLFKLEEEILHPERANGRKILCQK